MLAFIFGLTGLTIILIVISGLISFNPKYIDLMILCLCLLALSILVPLVF